jgi:hypothetical protein
MNLNYPIKTVNGQGKVSSGYLFYLRKKEEQKGEKYYGLKGRRKN